MFILHYSCNILKEMTPFRFHFFFLGAKSLDLAGRSGILDVLGDHLTAMTGVFSYGGRRPSQNIYLV